jgi:TolA-binding protein
MRHIMFQRTLRVASLSLLLIPGAGFAASREQQEMQRDIAQLQDQVRTLQSGFDQKMAALQTLMEQALEVGNRANTTVSVLNSSVTQTMDRELKSALTPVAGLTAKVDNVANDVSEVKNAMADLTTQLNRLTQQLTDVNNALKVIQAPQAAPPPPNVNQDGTFPPQSGAGAGRTQAPPAKTLFENANSDYSSGKSDLAATEFADFLRFYPDDPNAPVAQFFIGQIHEAQQKYDLAVMDFDAVLERYPENKYTTDALFMKGMALKLGGHRDLAATEFRSLIKKYPRSDRAIQATEQLRALGLSAAGSAGGSATARRKK